MAGLRPFLSYFGGKWQEAPHYPAPAHGTIIEPFAGSAGYALRYPERQVILFELNPKLAAVWQYLIAVKASEIRRIPLCEHVDDLPSWVSQPAKWLIGWNLNQANARPCLNLSAGLRKLGRGGWDEARRERVAFQVPLIRHWRCIEADYTKAPDVEATWFTDPPYFDKGRSSYDFGSAGIDYASLGRWCRERRGQTIVCENEGATWLPFRPFGTFHRSINAARGSREVVWTNRRAATPEERQLKSLAKIIGLAEVAAILRDEHRRLCAA